MGFQAWVLSDSAEANLGAMGVLQTDDWSQARRQLPDLAVLPATPRAWGELGYFDFPASPGAAESALPTQLPWLGGDLTLERWCSPSTIEHGQDERLSWRADGELLLLSWRSDCPSGCDPAPLAEAAYLDLVAQARSLGYPNPLRFWNILPEINEGRGDAERYRRFCLGRAHGLEARGIREEQLCAASAVGSSGHELRVHCLAGRQAGTPLENPRQVAAYRYPRHYGPRTPSFARALGLPLRGGEQALLISGTASIVGHHTCHPDETEAQLEETIHNLRTLLGEASQRLGRQALASFDARSVLRAYVRRPAEWPRIEARLRQAWPEAWLLGVQADICRADLTVEIEGFHRG